MMGLMKNHNIAAFVVIGLVVLGFTSAADNGSVTISQGGAHPAGGDLSHAVSGKKEVVEDEDYFDCLADTPNECSDLVIPAANGCAQWQSCFETCSIEGGQHLCATRCDTDYLDINSCSNGVSCGCSVCSKICDEDCQCED
jgi:hypothetical protein